MWTYTADPATEPRDAVRFLTGDVDETEQQLQDEELDWLITLWGDRSLYYVAAEACEAIAAKYAREIDINADSQSLGTNALQQKYLTQAERLRSQHEQLLVGGLVDAGGILVGEQPDPTVLPLAFGRGMHDNPEAGQQDYGGKDVPIWLPEIYGSW
jgi:hypothetical protein